jgi:hypothetical protein
MRNPFYSERKDLSLAKRRGFIMPSVASSKAREE